MRKIYFFKLVIPAQVLDKIKTLLFPQWGNSLGPECFLLVFVMLTRALQLVEKQTDFQSLTLFFVV